MLDGRPLDVDRLQGEASYRTDLASHAIDGQAVRTVRRNKRLEHIVPEVSGKLLADGRSAPQTDPIHTSVSSRSYPAPTWSADIQLVHHVIAVEDRGADRP